MSEELEQNPLESPAEPPLEKAEQPAAVEIPQTVTVSFKNKQEDLMSAIEAIDLRSREATRKTIHVMAVLLVGYWSVQLVVQQPSFIFGWLMLAATVALGIFVLREPRAGNLKYTARYVESAPEGTIVADEKGFVLQDGTGRDPFLYADGLKVYEYKNVLALSGSKRRFAMIPMDQLAKADQEALRRMTEKMESYEKVEPQKKSTGGFFKRK